MIKNTWKTLSLLAFCGAIVLANPADAKADEVSGPGLSSGNYIATVEAETVNISTDESGQEVLMAASRGSSFQVVEDMVDGNATVTQTDEATIAALEAAYDAPAEFRQSVVNYALQFVGGRYAYGGSDPHTGVDCSGFTRYIMQHAAGISLNRSSGGQASQGVAVSSDQMKPGDLIFYGNGRSINHVAMYIGNGQIVHSSTYKTGIKISQWNYRTPVKIVNVIGE